MLRKVFFAFVSVLAVSACNIDDLFDEGASGSVTVPGTEDDKQPSVSGLQDFRFCKVFVDDKKTERLLQWRDSVTMASADDRVEIAPGGTQIDWGQAGMPMYELVEYGAGEIEMLLQTVPEDAELASLSVVSGDPDILQVRRGEGMYGFRLVPKNIGDVTVTVTAGDKKGSLTKKYKVRVMATVGVKVYVDRFWKNPSLTYIRYRCTELPPDMEAVVLNIRDSLAVDAECRWKDVENGIHEEQAEEITYEFEGRSRDRLFRTGVRCMLCDFSDAFEYFSRQYRWGTEFVGDSDETCEVKYEYYPVRMRLFLDVCASSPFVAFNVVVKGNEYVYGKDDFADDLDDGMESDRDVADFFSVGFGGRMSQDDIAAEIERIKELLDDLGTSEQKQEWIDEIFAGMTPEEIEEMLEKIKAGNGDNGDNN